MTSAVVAILASVGLILFVSFVVARLLPTRTRGMSVRMQVFLALATIIGAFASALGLLVVDRLEGRATRLAQVAANDEAHLVAHAFSASLAIPNETLEKAAERWRSSGTESPLPGVSLHDATGRELLGAPPVDGPAATASAPVRAGGLVIGEVRVQKAILAQRRLLTEIAPALLLTMLVLGAAAAVAAAWIGSAIGGPIEKLSQYAEGVSLGEAVEPPPRQRLSREVARLVDSLQSMHRQLEGRPFVESFAADLSHELKNPVAAVRAAAELLEDGALDEPEEARRFVARIREAAFRMEKLLQELLNLARIEARGLEEPQPLDVEALIDSVVEHATDLDRRIVWQRTSSTTVLGDPVWLRQAINNLVTNALVHSTAGTTIELAVQQLPGKFELVVANAGELSPHVQRRLFRRFVTSKPNSGGTGLGLSIARAVARSHGGTLSLVAPGPPLVVFALQLPLASSRAPLRRRPGR